MLKEKYKTDKLFNMLCMISVPSLSPVTLDMCFILCVHEHVSVQQDEQKIQVFLTTAHNEIFTDKWQC